MSVRIAGGATEDGVVIGNTFDKYSSRNPIVRWLMRGFESSLTTLVQQAQPTDIHEIGCGEGYWVLRWHKQGFAVRGCDFSQSVIELARSNALEQDVSAVLFEQASIYDLRPERDSADLIVCCEVLEHLTDPHAALEKLQQITKRHLILSVPREPIWRALNLARGKYIGQLGNTPGHLQHWSAGAFSRVVSQYFDIVQTNTPLPWTMMLCRPKS